MLSYTKFIFYIKKISERNKKIGEGETGNDLKTITISQMTNGKSYINE
jgi:hypothetical protein